MSDSWEQIQILSKNRSRSKATEFGWGLFAFLMLAPWLFYDFGWQELFRARRLANASRFLGEVLPYPVQQEGFTFEAVFNWAYTLFDEKGFLAIQYSFAISVLSILIASFSALALSFFASRRLYYEEQIELGRQISFISRLIVFAVRVLALFYRAIPEYIWTFIFVMLIGVSAWPAILALALHNCGILTKLFSETVDDLPSAPLSAMRAVGAKPLGVGMFAAFPMALNRFLLYFFVRWETCVRESTVIGFLGIVSIGYWVEDARARNYYDELFFFVLLGTILVFIGDIAASLTRSHLRRA